VPLAFLVAIAIAREDKDVGAFARPEDHAKDPPLLEGLVVPGPIKRHMPPDCSVDDLVSEPLANQESLQHTGA
jgi:hypothetical protein